MSIEDLIQKAEFCSASKRIFVFEDECELTYYCCKKTSATECDENCNQCKSIYARYVILDLRDPTTASLCQEKIFKDSTQFNYFQENYLSEIFFYETEYVRYNIYLIFVYEDKEQIKDYIDFSSDINYARKLFLTPEEFDEYFGYYRKIKKYVTDSKYSMDQAILKELENIVHRLDNNGMKCVLLEEQNSVRNLINHFLINPINEQTTYDLRCGVKESAKTFIEKYIYKNKTISSKRLKNVRFVRKMKLSNYRETCFGDTNNFEFGIANIIYGANTVGKSSLLDAIELGFTGGMHKYNSEQGNDNSQVIIEDRNGNIISSIEAEQNSSELKTMWYPFKIGTLCDLFGRINYFDTDATYRFALEQGDNQEAYTHIKNLLSTSKLIEIENNLAETIREVSKVKDVIIDGKVFFKPYLTKTQAKKKRTFFDVLFRKDFLEQDIYRINERKLEITKQKIDEFESICTESLDKIKELIDKQIETNLKLLNIIFHKLYSQNCEILWHDGIFKMKPLYLDEYVTIEKMSTAQKVSLALSVIFTQFFLAVDAPQIILLDESVVNFDAFHLLNLFDFLREFTLNGVQIFFTTASDDIAQIAKSKLGFLGEDCCVYKLSKSTDGFSQIIKI